MAAEVVRFDQRRQKPADGADIILIPKQLRMEWTDLLAHDRSLSNSAFRVACIIGSHFNRRTGDTYVRQDTIAEKLGVSARTVWAAIGELERLGYLIISRRELGVRATDGRRVCGGRGVANTYLPAFERSQVVATLSGQKLAARCDLLWSERSQSDVTKVATHCDPTLTSSSKKNLTRAGADGRARDDASIAVGDRAVGSRPDVAASEPRDLPNSQPYDEASSTMPDVVLGKLRKRLGEAVFVSWLAKLAFVEHADGNLKLSAPTKYHAGRVSQDYERELLEVWREIYPTLRRIAIVPRGGGEVASAHHVTDIK